MKHIDIDDDAHALLTERSKQNDRTISKTASRLIREALQPDRTVKRRPTFIDTASRSTPALRSEPLPEDVA